MRYASETFFKWTLFGAETTITYQKRVIIMKLGVPGRKTHLQMDETRRFHHYRETSLSS